MRKAWAVCLLELKKVFQKKQSYFLMFAMPLIFTLIFGGLSGDGSSDRMKLAVVDDDQSTLSQGFLQSVKENELFTLVPESKQQAEQKVKDKKLGGMLYIPKGFEEQMMAEEDPKVVFKHGPEFTSATAISQMINQSLIKIKMELAASLQSSRLTGEDWKPVFSAIAKETSTASTAVHKIEVKKGKAQSKLNNQSASSAGFSIMFVMIVMMSVTGTILEAKKSGVWYRMMSTPISRFELMAGFFLAFFILGWIQFGILMAATSALFDIQWGDPLGIAVLVSALLLCVVGLGLFIAGFVTTTEQQSALGNIVIISTCMLGGVFWPLDVVPKFMQKIAEFVPQTWAMKGFTEIVARGGGVADIALPVAVLLLFSAVFLVVGMSRVKFQ